MDPFIEFKPIRKGKDLENNKFEAICELVQSLERLGTKLFSYTYVGGDVALVPKNYVGTIAFRDGESIQILPKITDSDDEDSIIRSKEVFLKMLLTVFNISSEETGKANLGITGRNPYEFFINMFISEVSNIVRKGIRSGYSDTEGNEYFIKGKILFNEDIRHNCSRRERTYQLYQTFDIDCPENRLIKATMKYLNTVSGDYENRKAIHQLMPYFDRCSAIGDVDLELRKCIIDRNNKHYAMAVKWCDIFLHNQSFTTFSGSDLAYTFLFPVEKVFEQYVARTLEENLTDCKISIQNTEKTIFDEGLTRIVKPDLVIEYGDRTVVLDTKWKVINSNGDISDDDLRQMKEYSADFHGPAILVYPKISFDEEIISTRGDIEVRTSFIDLYNDFDGWWKRYANHPQDEI